MNRLAIILLVLVLAGQPASGATNAAADCGLATIQSLIDDAVAGDTILVPAGSTNWADTLDITNSISVLGSGTNATIITANNGALYLTGTGGGTMRVGGFQFILGSSADAINVAMSPTNSFRIDHCFLSGSDRLFVVWGCGLVDNCTILQPVKLAFVHGPSPGRNYTDAEQTWLRTHWYPLDQTSLNALFFEDNEIVWTSFNNNVNYAIQTSDCGNYVVRYNTIRLNATASGTQMWDYHGNQGRPSPSGSNIGAGSIMLGVYMNQFIHSGTPEGVQWVYARAGSGLIFSNTASGNMTGWYNQFQEEDFDDYGSPPYEDPVTNIWVGVNTPAMGYNYYNDVENGVAVWVNEEQVYPSAYTPYPHPMIAAMDGEATTNPPAIPAQRVWLLK